MKAEQPNHIHIWCYAHVLNLVIGDASSVCVPVESFFKLLSNLSIFLNQSFKRMKIWEGQMKSKSGSSKFCRLECIGQTRWSSKGRGLQKLFVSFTDQSNGIFSDLLLILNKISNSTDFKR